MSTVDEERLTGLGQMVPPVLTPPVSGVYRRAARLRRRQRAYRVPGVVGLVAAGVLCVTVLPSRFDSRSAAGHSPSASAVPELSCVNAVKTSPLPVWARAGFTPPDQAIAHVTGSQGNIVGILFGELHAPPLRGQGNKILWVATGHGGSGDPDLRIHATLNGSHLAVDQVVVGGPGPSGVDVPRAGCWTFTLRWSGHQEEVALRYS